MTFVDLGHLNASTVTDVYTDNNSIVSASFLAQPTGGSEQGFIAESYGETYLQAFGGSDDFAIVNEDGNYFDKVFDATGLNKITFLINNTTTSSWSGFYFEFYTDSNFDTSWSDVPLSSWSSDIFSISSFGSGVLSFSSPNTQEPDDVNTIILNFSENLNGSFGMRQIPVTSAPVPIPSAVWLLAPGIIGLVGFKRKLGR